MIKTIKTMSKQEKGALHRPPEGAGCDPSPPYLAGRHLPLWGNKFSKTYKFSDINYLVASREDKGIHVSHLFGAAQFPGFRCGDENHHQ